MLRLSYLAQAVLIAACSVTDNTGVLMLSSLVMGAFVPGCTSLVLGRLRQLMPGDAAAQTSAWGLATIGFAMGQAIGAYGLSYLFDLKGDYTLLFAGGAGAIAIALALNLVLGKRV